MDPNVSPFIHAEILSQMDQFNEQDFIEIFEELTNSQIEIVKSALFQVIKSKYGHEDGTLT